MQTSSHVLQQGTRLRHYFLQRLHFNDKIFHICNIHLPVVAVVINSVRCFTTKFRDRRCVSTARPHVRYITVHYNSVGLRQRWLRRRSPQRVNREVKNQRTHPFYYLITSSHLFLELRLQTPLQHHYECSRPRFSKQIGYYVVNSCKFSFQSQVNCRPFALTSKFSATHIPPFPFFLIK